LKSVNKLTINHGFGFHPKKCLNLSQQKLIRISLTHSLVELYFRTLYNSTVKNIPSCSLIPPPYSKSKCRLMINDWINRKHISHLRTWFFMKMIHQNSRKNLRRIVFHLIPSPKPAFRPCKSLWWRNKIESRLKKSFFS